MEILKKKINKKKVYNFETIILKIIKLREI